MGQVSQYNTFINVGVGQNITGVGDLPLCCKSGSEVVSIPYNESLQKRWAAKTIRKGGSEETKKRVVKKPNPVAEKHKIRKIREGGGLLVETGDEGTLEKLLGHTKLKEGVSQLNNPAREAQT